MKRHHLSYSNVRYWKVMPIDGGFAVVPNPKGALNQLLIALPGAGVFYWVLHGVLEIENPTMLLLADFALLLGLFASLVVYLLTRCKALKDTRPFIEVSSLTNRVSFPRLDKSYDLGDPLACFVAYDYDSVNLYSELNLVEVVDGEERAYPLLHYLNRCKDFERIGDRLKELGVLYRFRD